ncbi:hypothetical protein IW262DRAFT_1280777 [Armillaria fumosa]|nr:hypothetical protein IW262DRAFT_1280777 [Armillaria fumosa]
MNNKLESGDCISQGTLNGIPCKKGKCTRAAWVIESLNMKGRGARMTAKSKWSDINNIMHEQQISILTLQKTHLTEQHVGEIHALFGKRLCIFHSQDPTQPTGRAGVALVLNKELVKTKDAKMTEIISGRAILVQAPWHADSLLMWLMVYALNTVSENCEFWKQLQELWEERSLPKPDGMSGDLNFVEDDIDRLPVHEDDATLVTTFKAFKRYLGLQDGLQDGWHETHPTEKDYTYISRIDRIYVRGDLMNQCNEWKILEPMVNTDHRAISVQMTHTAALYLGKGHWTMPLHLLNNNKMLCKIEQMLENAINEINGIGNQRNKINNPQTVYTRYKKKIVDMIKKYAKKSIPMKRARLEELQARIKSVLMDDTLPEDN